MKEFKGAFARANTREPFEDTSSIIGQAFEIQRFRLGSVVMFFVTHVIEQRPAAFDLAPREHATVGASRTCCQSWRTTAVTGPPPKNCDFKTRVIGGSRSPLGYMPLSCSSAGRNRFLMPNAVFAYRLAFVADQ